MLDKAASDQTLAQTQSAASPVMSAVMSTEPKPNILVRLLRWIVQFVLMVAIVAGAIVFMNRAMDRAPDIPSKQFTRSPLMVTAQEVTLSNHQPKFSSYGKIVAGNSFEVKSPVAGRIIDISPNLSVGESVSKGEMLLAIDDFVYQGAVLEAKADIAQTEAALAEGELRLVSEQNQLEGAQSQLEIAEADLARAKQLLTRGALTKKQVDDRDLLVNQRQLAVDQRRNNIQIEGAKKAQQIATLERLKWRLQRAERSLADTQIMSPIDGRVAFVNAELGREANTQEVLLRLDQSDALEVEFTLSDAQYGRLLNDNAPIIGRAVSVSWTVGTETYEYAANISRLGAEIQTDLGGVVVFAVLNNSENQQKIRPGAFVEIRVPDKSYELSAAIPETSVYDGNTVYVIGDDGRLKAREVTIAAVNNGEAIVSVGLQNGENVLTTRLSRITGRPVEIIDPNAAAKEPEQPQVETSGQNAGGRPSPELLAQVKADNDLTDEAWSALPREKRQELIQAARAKNGG